MWEENVEKRTVLLVITNYVSHMNNPVKQCFQIREFCTRGKPNQRCVNKPKIQRLNLTNTLISAGGEVMLNYLLQKFCTLSTLIIFLQDTLFFKNTCFKYLT